MNLTVRLRFDGSVLIPQEPIDLAVGQIVEASLSPAAAPSAEETWQVALERLSKRGPQGIVLAPDALGRSSIYPDRI